MAMASNLEEFKKLTTGLKEYRDVMSSLANQTSAAVTSEAFVKLLESNSVIKRISDYLIIRTRDISKFILDGGDDYDKMIMQISRYFLNITINNNPHDFKKELEDMKELSFTESVDQLTPVFFSNFTLTDKLKETIDMEKDEFKTYVSSMCRDALDQLVKKAFEIFDEFHEKIPKILKNDELTNQEKILRITNTMV